MIEFLKNLLFKWLNKKTHGNFSKQKRKIQNNTHSIQKYQEIEEVKLKKVIDGDTGWFRFRDGEEYKVRFLFIDTPEATKTVEKYGPEAAKFVYHNLKNAKKIELEFDFERVDRHNRVLAWIWYYDRQNNKYLLQEEVAKNGFVEKFYDYGNYKYEKRIRKNLNDKYNIFQSRR